MVFLSYISGRTFVVSINNTLSEHYKLSCGVPQGSILGPLLFNLICYLSVTLSGGMVQCIFFHSYADDTQLYVAMFPNVPVQLDSLVNCIQDIKDWMSQNFLQLNQDKTEVLIIGLKGQREKLIPKLNILGLNPSQVAKKLEELSLIQNLTLNSCT